MRKLLSTFLISAAFLSLDAQSLVPGVDSSNWRCKTHNSNGCKSPAGFLKELNDGCASIAGNCRYRFCGATCAASGRDIYDPNQVVSDAATGRHIGGKVSTAGDLCKQHCFAPQLLARFDSKTRKRLYTNVYGTDKSGLETALKIEGAIVAAKGKQWFNFRRKNDKLLKALAADYLALLTRNKQKMDAAQDSGDTQAAEAIKRQSMATIIEAAAVIANAEVTTPQVTVLQQEAQSSNADKREKAARILQKYWRTKKGQTEAKKRQAAQQEAAKRLSVVAGVPVPEKAKRLSGESSQGPDGVSYFIPAAPPQPKNEKIKRDSQAILAEKRRSLSQDDTSNLPPPPAFLTEDEGVDMSIPAAPLPPATTNNSNAAFLKSIQTGVPLKKVTINPRTNQESTSLANALKRKFKNVNGEPTEDSGNDDDWNVDA